MTEQREILRQTAGMVASALGDGWTVDTESDYVWQTTLFGPDNERLYFSAAKGCKYGETDKLNVSGGYSHLATHAQMPYQLKHVEINVTRHRGPEAIAKEIRRRLLPEYHAEIARVVASVDDSVTSRAARLALAERIGGDIRDDSESRTTVYVPGGKFQVSYRGDSVNVDLYSCPPDMAVALAELLRNAEKATS